MNIGNKAQKRFDIVGTISHICKQITYLNSAKIPLSNDMTFNVKNTKLKMSISFFFIFFIFIYANFPNFLDHKELDIYKMQKE